MPRCVCLLDVIHDLVEAKLQHPPLPAKPIFKATIERPAEGYGARVVTNIAACRRQAHA